jgi:DNA-binding CsgD family transcriptional regulator
MPMLVDLLFDTVDGAFAVDAMQRVVFWNRGCEQLLNRPAREVLGRRCCEVLQGSDAAGKAICRPDCDVAELACGGPSPGSFALSADDSHGAKQRLKVGIVLMPSPAQRGQWTVVHLLQRSKAATTIDVLEGNGQRGQWLRADSIENKARLPAAESALTVREDEVFRLLAEGLALKAISARLHISLVTVRNHVQHIQSKLGVHSQVETVAYAYRHQLI